MDSQWLAQCRDGDSLAIERLVQTHQADVYRLALSILDDPDEADDATQEAFISALRALNLFRAERVSQNMAVQYHHQCVPFPFEGAEKVRPVCNSRFRICFTSKVNRYILKTKLYKKNRMRFYGKPSIHWMRNIASPLSCATITTCLLPKSPKYLASPLERYTPASTMPANDCVRS